MSICVSVLTCNNRNTTKQIVESFLNTTNFVNLDLVIYAQGCTNEYIQDLKTIDNPEINLKIIVKPENKGLTFGLNDLNTHLIQYEYVLFLEDDWICLADHKEWLNDCIKLLNEHSEISTVFLRKYFSDKEKHTYGWTRHIQYYMHKNPNNFNYQKKMENSHKIQIGNSHFQHIPEYLYTNNPHIRRNKDYYEKQILPFVHYDDIKTSFGEWTDSNSNNNDTKYWGYSEGLAMEKHLNLKAYYYNEGIFGHYEDWDNK